MDGILYSPHHAGSSPRLRGTAPNRYAGPTPHRFIPAPAGNGASSIAQTTTTAVHPRACGERVRNMFQGIARTGSSPRLRGTAAQWLAYQAVQRFIPAPAGNGELALVSMAMATVHPRACGERRDKLVEYQSECGSSPRLRGTATATRSALARRRFIPAPAGNGIPERLKAAVRAVHPRACGERQLRRQVGNAIRGSSPRLRGTGQSQQRLQGRRRFIPAPAGNGQPPGRVVRHHAVHPRACGERLELVGEPCLVVGSSPRLRGTGTV